RARGPRRARPLPCRRARVTTRSAYARPLEASLESAPPLAAARGLRLLTRADLGEVRYGLWTGRKVKLLARTNLWKVVHDVPSRARFPGGESRLEVQNRMVQEVQRIAALHPKRGVSVCS